MTFSQNQITLRVELYIRPVADPGFPIEEAWTRYGSVDLRHGYFSIKVYAKTKELGPIGGVCRISLYVDPPLKTKVHRLRTNMFERYAQVTNFYLLIEYML